MNTTAVILAAGQGTRMHSSLPKVLHTLLGSPLIHYPIVTSARLTGRKPVVVVGHQSGKVIEEIGDRAVTVLQEEQLGTGHALMKVQGMAQDLADFVLVMTADMPLLSEQTLRLVTSTQWQNLGPLTMLVLQSPNSRGFGRVLFNPDASVKGIVEEADASEAERLIQDLNAGVYCFRADWLWQNLDRIPLSQKGEYYLTDLVGIAAGDGLSVKAIVSQDSDELIGINNRVDLAAASKIFQRRINERWMVSGVSLVDPDSAYIEPTVMIGQDTVIYPNTFLQGDTTIGEGCEVGPNTIVRSTKIGDGCKILASVLEEAVIEDHVDMGPFAHLRRGAHLASGVHMGNFGEVKNSYLAPGVKMGHFSYIGDAHVGQDVNIGAGTITCNFGMDGKKNKTDIGDRAFIGSDTLLVAPVKIGEDAATGSGAVVTRDVPSGTLAVGMPARAIRRRNLGDEKPK